ncbi:hypothetical protein CEXT_454351 [Caerostris extrusa]|uniref:Uncharacterized protein n=1 Tax=Caerostris extrusa TaxID=172846 RepID=A0AAV4MYJ5_CAEEX|nr:hypothetical protein CEXT_454351 [Caerostris extrusa]
MQMQLSHRYLGKKKDFPPQFPFEIATPFRPRTDLVAGRAGAIFPTLPRDSLTPADDNTSAPKSAASAFKEKRWSCRGSPGRENQTIFVDQRVFLALKSMLELMGLYHGRDGFDCERVWPIKNDNMGIWKEFLIW